MAEVTDIRTSGDAVARLRTQLATCVRLLHMEQLITYNGHVSARLPESDTFLIHSRGEARGDVSPQSLLAVDFDGKAIDGGAEQGPPSEVYIHSEIYRARSDVRAVVHVHSESAIAFTLAEGAVLRPMRCDAVRWSDGIPVHPDPSRIRTPAQGRELAATLGSRGAALMRAHGAVLVAESVPAILASSVQFEENARAQILATHLGEPLPLDDAELGAMKESSRPEFLAHYALKIWRYYVSKGISQNVIPAAWGLGGTG
jgi:ribulose-5-phosphate 4-epimerase/fuculose-1-phosphate aldolase